MIYGRENIKVGGYIRLSKEDEKAGQSTSVISQNTIIEDECRKRNLILADVYIDDGWSGTNFDRPNWNRLLFDIKCGKINCVMVKDLSRLGRNYLMVGQLLEQDFPVDNVRFISISDDIDTAQKEIDSDSLLSLKNCINEFYPASTSKRTKEVLYAKSSRGEYLVNTAMYGYKKSASAINQLEIDEQVSHNVVRIFEMLVYQNYGVWKIAKVLEEDRILKPSAYQAQIKGNPLPPNPYKWTATTVHKIIHNRCCIGDLVYGKKKKLSFKVNKRVSLGVADCIVVENVHDPIIPLELWEQAQNRIVARKQPKRDGQVNIFSGLIFCEDCGSAMSLNQRSNSTRIVQFLNCGGYKRKKMCTSHYIKYDILYEKIRTDIRDLFSIIGEDDSKSEAILLDYIISNQKATDSDAIEQLNATEKRLSELDMMLASIYEDKISGALPASQFQKMLEKITSEQNHLDGIKSNLANMVQINNHDPHIEARKFLKAAKEYLSCESLSYEMLSRLVHKIQIGERYIQDGVEQQNITITYKFMQI